MEDKTVIKLGTVIKIYVELDSSDVIIKIFDKNVPDLSENSWHAFVLKSFDKKFMIHSYKLRHYI
jgi:hypothetical protein